MPCILDFLPRRSLADFSECSKTANQFVASYARKQLDKSELGKSLIKRHLDGTSAERGMFSPAFFLHCVDAAPQIGSYFMQQDFQIRAGFDAMMQSMYPNDINIRSYFVQSGRVMFMIDGIVVHQAIEGYSHAPNRFAVCRCPLPTLIRSLETDSVKAWKSGGSVRWQNDLERMWEEGSSMYDYQVLEAHGIHVFD